MKALVALITFTVVRGAMACPYCAGAADSPDRNSVWILGVFILLTYIPFYILFKMAFKKRKIDEQ